MGNSDFDAKVLARETPDASARYDYEQTIAIKDTPDTGVFLPKEVERKYPDAALIFGSHWVFPARGCTDIRHVQEILGLSDVRTTLIYTHVLVPNAKQIGAIMLME
jgi:hypothetical protein